MTHRNRHLPGLALLLMVSVPDAAVLAQELAPSDLVIDILVPVQTTDEADSAGACKADQGDTAEGPEILVCGEVPDDSAYYYSGSREAAEDRYAARTAFAGDVATPDVAGPGIFRGPATVGGLCGFIFNPCPAPQAYLIDFTTLPDTPAGSDADRIAKGLDRSDDDDSGPRALSEFEKQELGLPPAPLPTSP
ncbi:MAG: hypothetical protein WAT93_11225 [Pontixanthobacter sp.]